MNHVILRDGRLMSAADFAVAYLANPTLTCAVIVPEVSFSDAAGSAARRVGPHAGTQPAPLSAAAGDPPVDAPVSTGGTGAPDQGGHDG